MKFVLGDHMVITWKLPFSRRDLAFDGAKMKFIVGRQGYSSATGGDAPVHSLWNSKTGTPSSLKSTKMIDLEHK